ncbi:hypothetical protein TL16_g02002 [Triparma laevis f. inornata]|uniref:Uncharacterized protein n=1 Tax=Triparma laevis f. inornata TaxID=1714386 RepID=A0A9W7DTM4_9STRA|nr:hypothetical protein TL16_g02002 [Triparma laevis f. inornata]
MQIDNQCISCFGKDYSIANVGGGGGVEDVNCVERPARRSTCTTVGEEVQPTITRSAAGNGTPCRERSIVCTRGDGSIPLPIVDVDCVESPAERGTCTTVGEEIFPRIQTQKAGNGRRCPQVPVVCGAGDIPFLVVNPPQTDEWQSGGCNGEKLRGAKRRAGNKTITLQLQLRY